MQIKLPFDTHKPVTGAANIEIDKAVDTVFSYIGTHFFENYPKWAAGVVDFEPLDGQDVFIGAKARQIRNDNKARVESVFSITDYHPPTTLVFQGLNAPYKHSYFLENTQKPQSTRLIFRFELLELDVFMRPFEKLIRAAIEDGAETTVETLKNLVESETTSPVAF